MPLRPTVRCSSRAARTHPAPTGKARIALAAAAVVCLGAALTVSCMRKDPTAAELGAKLEPDQTPPEYFSGVQAYNAECVRCHKAFDASHFTDDQWRAFMPKHGKDVRIDRPTMTLILRYMMKNN